MHIREYNEGDLEELQTIHAAQGFPYEFPDLRNPLFLTKLVLSGDESGVEKGKGIAGAALLRLTAEAYLLLDPQRGTPKERWQWLLALTDRRCPLFGRMRTSRRGPFWRRVPRRYAPKRRDY